MNISVDSGYIYLQDKEINSSKKVLIAGKASSSFKAREIISPSSKEEAKSLFGHSELYDAYCLLSDMKVEQIYLCNCYSESDYIRLVDKIIHYDFSFFIPLGIYFSDMFYNPIDDRDEYYSLYFTNQLGLTDSLTTIIMTERHASLYKDFDHYVNSMKQIEKNVVDGESSYSKKILDKWGNNLTFVYNNLNDVAFSNVVLSGLFCNRDYAKYLKSLQDAQAVYDIDSVDMIGSRAMYFKNNYYTLKATVENPFNCREINDIYANALIDDVIKSTIRIINLDQFKGKLYNQYISRLIFNEVSNKLSGLKGRLFKTFEINKIHFKETEPGAGTILIDYSIVPYGTLENINVMLGV